MGEGVRMEGLFFWYRTFLYFYILKNKLINFATDLIKFINKPGGKIRRTHSIASGTRR